MNWMKVFGKGGKGVGIAGVAAAIACVPAVSAVAPAAVVIPLLTGVGEGLWNWFKHKGSK